jgi:hypothetical protein
MVLIVLLGRETRTTLLHHFFDVAEMLPKRDEQLQILLTSRNFTIWWRVSQRLKKRGGMRPKALSWHGS